MDSLRSAAAAKGAEAIGFVQQKSADSFKLLNAKIAKFKFPTVNELKDKLKTESAKMSTQALSISRDASSTLKAKTVSVIAFASSKLESAASSKLGSAITSKLESASSKLESAASSKLGSAITLKLESASSKLESAASSKLGSSITSKLESASSKLESVFLKLTSAASKLLSNSKINMESEVFFIGGTTLPPEAVATGGKKMERHFHYLLENTTLTSPDGSRQIHVGTVELNNQVGEWINTIKSLPQGEKKPTFQEYISDKMKKDPAFAKKLMDNEVRYFNDKDRQDTVITFENGQLRQVGLDSGDSDLKKLGPKENDSKASTTYAFSLGRGDDGDKLFMAPKVGTSTGRIQHSSFLQGGNTLSAGMIVVGKDGKIESIRNQSGHYTPTKTEMARVLNYLKENLSKEDFNKIHLSINVNEGWKLTVGFFLHEHLSIKWGLVEKPAHEWLEKHNKEEGGGGIK